MFNRISTTFKKTDLKRIRESHEYGYQNNKNSPTSSVSSSVSFSALSLTAAGDLFRGDFTLRDGVGVFRSLGDLAGGADDLGVVFFDFASGDADLVLGVFSGDSDF